MDTFSLAALRTQRLPSQFEYDQLAMASSAYAITPGNWTFRNSNVMYAILSEDLFDNL